MLLVSDIVKLIGPVICWYRKREPDLHQKPMKNLSMSFLSRSTQLVRACGPKQAIGRLVQSNARAASG